MCEEEAPYVSKAISNRWWIHAVLLVLLGLTLYPMVFMVLNAFRTGLATDITPFGLPFHPIWQNFSIALSEILPAFKQSFIIVGVSVAGILTCALLSAFAFAELEFPGKTVLFYLVFGLLLIPGFLALIPLFLEVRNLGLMNSVWGLILPYVAGGQAFGIFIFRTFIKSLPDELFAAARVDGAHNGVIFWRIVVPLSWPIVMTVAVLNIVGLWGDYILPSLVLAAGHQTVAVAITSLTPPPFASSANSFNEQLAAFTLSSVPIAVLFMFLMRFFVRGVTNGALKM